MKYEFIDKLLKQSDKNLTSNKALIEVTNMYKGLLERNQHLSSRHGLITNVAAAAAFPIT